MLRYKKWTSLLALTVPITTIFVSTSLTTHIRSGQIYFDGRKFNSAEEAMAYLVQNEKIRIGQQKVLGNIERSYINSETGLLNKSLLPNYDPTKMHFAYKNAGGRETADYQEAKNTYFNPGTVVSMYDDGYGNNTFLSEKDAENSMRSKSIVSRMGFYNVDYVNVDINNNLILRKKRLNPFNMTDINKYKQNIKEHIFDIMSKNLEMDARDSASNSTSDYLISNFRPSKLVAKNNSQNDSNPKLGILSILKEKIHEYGNGWSLDKKSNLTNTIEDDEQKINVNLESWDVYMSHTRWTGDKYDTWGGIRYHFANHDKRWTWGTKRPWMTLDKLKQFFNQPNLKEVGFAKDEDRVTSVPSTRKREIAITNMTSKLKDWIRIVKFWNNLLIIYKQDKLRKQIWKQLGKKVSDNISNLDVKGGKDEYQFTSMPDLHVKGWNAGWFDYWNWAKVVNKKGGYNFGYRRMIKLKIENEPIEKDNTPDKLLTSLLNWTDENKQYTFTIKKDGQSLFDVTVGFDNIKKIIKVENIKLSANNHTNNEKSLLLAPSADQAKRFMWFKDGNNNIEPIIPTIDADGASETNIQKYFYWLLTAFNEELNKGNDPSKKSAIDILDIFYKYFGDSNRYFGLAKKNIRYKFDMDFNASYPGRKKLLK